MAKVGRPKGSKNKAPAFARGGAGLAWFPRMIAAVHEYDRALETGDVTRVAAAVGEIVDAAQAMRGYGGAT